MKLLKELFFGNIAPFEQKMMLTKEGEEERREFIRLEREFLAQLSAEQKQCYRKCEAVKMKIETEEASCFFVCGFRLGARLALELLEE